ILRLGPIQSIAPTKMASDKKNPTSNSIQNVACMSLINRYDSPTLQNAISSKQQYGNMKKRAYFQLAIAYLNIVPVTMKSNSAFND
ncbi:hypothetical protein, partial [Escherichia coli]|uniref:hypothetical protein n=1 Tax=Escherichia coli TaxID=562 RepID=UPI00132F6160